MHFNEKDEKVFERLDDYLLNIYIIDSSEETDHRLNIGLDFVKRMIAELSQKRCYDITGNESYDVNVLLKEIIEVPIDSKQNFLADFDPLLYKKPEEFYNYFNLLTKDLSWEDLCSIAESFKWINNGFQSFFANHFDKLLHLASKIYYELDVSEEQDNFASITAADNEEDDDWVEDYEQDSLTEKMVLSFEELGEWDFDDKIVNEFNNSTTNNKIETNELDKETLVSFVKFINVVKELIKYRKLGYNIINKLYELSRQKKLEDFYSNEEFSKMLDLIMEHDRACCFYYYHGTQCLEDAQTIMEEGLGMMRENLRSTSYCEFTKDQVILYERGLGNQIGQDAIVIIEVPKNDNGEELNVVMPLDDQSKIHFAPSGLQGYTKPSYIVLPENIVGYVDKKNKQIVFNHKYRNYEEKVANNNKMHI